MIGSVFGDSNGWEILRCKAWRSGILGRCGAMRCSQLVEQISRNQWVEFLVTNRRPNPYRSLLANAARAAVLNRIPTERCSHSPVISPMGLVRQRVNARLSDATQRPRIYTLEFAIVSPARRYAPVAFGCPWPPAWDA